MAVCTSVLAALIQFEANTDAYIQGASVFFVFAICFFIWHQGLWGGADARWLPLCLAWIPLNDWPSWFFIWGGLFLMHALLTTLIRAYRAQSFLINKEIAMIPSIAAAQAALYALKVSV